MHNPRVDQEWSQDLSRSFPDERTSLKDPLQRQAVRLKTGVYSELMLGRADYFGLDRLHLISYQVQSEKGFWQANFGEIKIPQLENEAKRLRVGVALYGVGTNNGPQFNHVIVGISEDPQRTQQQFLADLGGITRDLVEKPSSILDYPVGRNAAVFVPAGLVAVVTYAHMMGGAGSGLENSDLLIKAVVSGSGGFFTTAFIGLGAYIWDESRKGRRFKEQNPRINEYFADNEAVRVFSRLGKHIAQQRIRHAAYQALKSDNASVVNPHNFELAYQEFRKQETGGALMTQIAKDLPPLKEKSGGPIKDIDLIVTELQSIQAMRAALR